MKERCLRNKKTKEKIKTRAGRAAQSPTMMGTNGGMPPALDSNTLTMYGRCISRLCSFSSTSMSMPESRASLARVL